MPLVDEELLQLSRRLLGRANVSPIIPAVRVPGVIQIDQVLDAPVRLMMDVGPEIRRQAQASKGLKRTRMMVLKIVVPIVAGAPTRRSKCYTHPATDVPALIIPGAISFGNDVAETVNDGSVECQLLIQSSLA